jgi:hypothetical protein
VALIFVNIIVAQIWLIATIFGLLMFNHITGGVSQPSYDVDGDMDPSSPHHFNSTTFVGFNVENPQLKSYYVTDEHKMTPYSSNGRVIVIDEASRNPYGMGSTPHP